MHRAVKTDINRYLFFVGYGISVMMSQKPWQRVIAVTLNMRYSTSLLIIIMVRWVMCKIQCFLCEAESDEIICRTPRARSAIGEAVYCSADGVQNVCSTTSYIRRCRFGEGEAIRLRLL